MAIQKKKNNNNNEASMKTHYLSFLFKTEIPLP